MRYRFSLPVGPGAFPTTVGHSLEFQAGSVDCGFEMRVVHSVEDEEFPDETLAADYYIADAEGRVWKTTSQFKTEVLIERMIDVSGMSCHGLLACPENEFVERLFRDRCLVREAHFPSDDRFIRKVPVNGRLVEIQFKYTSVTMDLAAMPNRVAGGLTEILWESPEFRDVYVRVLADSFYDYESTDDLGCLHFSIAPEKFLLHNTAYWSEVDENYFDSALPLPLRFEPTDEQGPPQEHVRLASS